MANWAKLQEDTIGLPVYKRAKHGIHFQRSDGQIQANFSGKPCHYLDSGLWKPIDTRLLKLPDGFYGCAHSPVRVHADGRVKVTGSDYAQFTKLPGSPIGKADGDRIIREFAGGYQELFVTEDGFREVITVLKPTFPLEKFIGKSSGKLPSAYKANPQTAMDANGDMYVITADTKAFGGWLDKAVYPVVIDPDFAGGAADNCIRGQNATWATARSTASSILGGYLRTGTQAYEPPTFNLYFVNRSFVLFDTSTIGAGSTVTQVNLKLTPQIDVTDAGFEFDVQIVKQDWSSQNPITTGNMDAAYDGCLAGDADDSILSNTADLVVNTTKTSGNLATAWVSKTGTTYYSLRGSNDYNNVPPEKNTSGDQQYFQFYDISAATESYRPVLTVTYTVPSTAFVNILDHQQSVILGGSIVR